MSMLTLGPQDSSSRCQCSYLDHKPAFHDVFAHTRTTRQLFKVSVLILRPQDSISWCLCSHSDHKTALQGVSAHTCYAHTRTTRQLFKVSVLILRPQDAFHVSLGPQDSSSRCQCSYLDHKTAFHDVFAHTRTTRQLFKVSVLILRPQDSISWCLCSHSDHKTALQGVSAHT